MQIMMIRLIVVSSWLGILESCNNGYEKLDNRKLRPFGGWPDGGSENAAVVSPDHGKIPAQLWWKRGRQKATHHDGNRILNPYNIDTNAVSDGIKETKPWGRPTRRIADTHGERWPGNRAHYSRHFQDIETDHSGLGEGVVDKGGD